MAVTLPSTAIPIKLLLLAIGQTIRTDKNPFFTFAYLYPVSYLGFFFANLTGLGFHFRYIVK